MAAVLLGLSSSQLNRAALQHVRRQRRLQRAAALGGAWDDDESRRYAHARLGCLRGLGLQALGPVQIPLSHPLFRFKRISCLDSRV